MSLDGLPDSKTLNEIYPDWMDFACPWLKWDSAIIVWHKTRGGVGVVGQIRKKQRRKLGKHGKSKRATAS